MARVLVFLSNPNDVVANTESAWAEIRWGVRADCDALVARGVSAKWLGWALDNGARFVVAEEDGRIIGHNIFLTHDRVWLYDWLLIRLDAKHDVLSTASFVIPERRRRHVFVSIKRFAAEYFADKGYRRMVSVVEAGNTASIQAHRRVGAVRWTTVSRARVGKLRLVWRDGALPHMSWGAEPFALDAATIDLQIERGATRAVIDA